MKNIFLILSIFALLNSCSKSEDAPDCQGIDCLPPIIQTGAGTFGCLVNGEPYFSSNGLNSFYQLVNGEFSLLIGFDRDAGFPESVSIIGNGEVFENQQYDLADPSSSVLYGNVIFRLDTNTFETFENTTNSFFTGTAQIDRLDITNQIISGTFEFSILNPETNQIVNITEGRFDSFYTR